MSLIVEGPDCVGKSTVTELLRSLLPGWAYRHHTKPPLPDPYAYLSWFCADTHPRVLIDRLHWSEITYGFNYRGASQLTQHQWRLLELQNMCKVTKVLLMWDEIEAIRSRWDDDNQMFAKAQLEGLWHLYDHLYNDVGMYGYKSYLPRVRHTLPELVDGNGKPTDRLLSLAAELESTAIHFSAMLPASLGYGSPSPMFMVLGEAPGKPDPASLYPPCSFDFGPAAEWFWRAMDQIEANWWQGYYTNASAFTDKHQFVQYINHVLAPRVILCMGNKAFELVRAAMETKQMRPDTKVRVVKHPGYVRRFQHSEFDQWANEIRDALLVCGAVS